MTAHELAKRLLEMDDLPIGTYDDSDYVVEVTQIVSHKVFVLTESGDGEIVDGFLIY